MIDVRDLTKHYAAAAGLRSLLPGRRGAVTRAVEGVSFTYFTAKDVVRHPLVQRIVHAYETHEQKAVAQRDQA